VDTELEMTEFADRARVKQGGPALLFEARRDQSIPVLINSICLSMQRMEIAMEVDSVDEVAARICGF
jgi:UbiD family decarboxylase